MQTTKYAYNPFYGLKQFMFKTEVKVLNCDSIKLYTSVKKQHPLSKILLLSMANAYTPGGQYKLQKNNFFMGQEESIFAKTDIEIDLKFYPIRDNEVLLTTEVHLKESLTTLDIVSCPAIDIRTVARSEELEYEIYNKMYIKISTIFQVALEQGYDTLILGALGCGGFAIPPEIVSMVFQKVIQEYTGMFKQILFAITDTDNHPKNNFNTFRKYLKK